MNGLPSSRDRKNSLKVIVAAGIAGITLLVGTMGFGLIRHLISGHRFNGLGEFGDYVGGVANPLLALLGYLALLYTIILQREELSLSREELVLTRQELERSASALEAQTLHLYQQSLSQAFFDLFEMYKSVVEGIEWGSTDSRRIGKAALEQWRDQFVPFAFYNDDPWTVSALNVKHDEVNAVLGNYFRVIFRLFVYLSEAGKKGEFFADMFRAQLSTAELHLLFFNCVSITGKPMEKYAVEFELFDNMPVPSGSGIEAIVNAVDARALGKNNALRKLHAATQSIAV